MDRVHVIGNPTARRGIEAVAAVVARLSARGVAAAVIDADTPETAAAAARQAVEDGAERLVCVGGDGVARIAVGAVAGSSTVLGIVPHGTGNDFARALGLLDHSVGTAISPRRRLAERVDRAMSDGVPVDAIRTDHGWAATVVTIGFSGDVTARANALRWPRGQLRYTVATLLQLPRLRTLPLDVTVDGDTVHGDTTLLAVGNTAYFGGGMRICPGAWPDDGQLQLVSIGGVPRRTFLRVFPTVFSGRHVDHPVVTARSGRVVTLAARNADVDGPGLHGTGVGGAGADDLWADGDRLGPLPVTLEVVPGAVRIAGVRIDPRP